MLTMSNYSDLALKTADYPRFGNNAIYPSLKLNGEAGEVAEKVGKLWRNLGKEDPLDYSKDERHEIALELGDVLWYIAACAHEIGYELETVARMNIDKLTDRKNRNVIKSEGDNR